MADVQFPPSIWVDTTPARPLSPSLEADCETDAVVIGGGFTGLSAALEFLRAGQGVVLLEGKGIGWGASGRNNGQVIPTLSAAEPDKIITRHGAAGERLVKLIGNSASALFDLIREEGINAEAEQTGWFQPAHSPGRVGLSRRRVEAWNKHGFPARLLDWEETRTLLGSDHWFGGMFNPTGGHINPLALTRELAGVVAGRGATIHEGTLATGWRKDGDAWVVSTANGARVRARHMILATNAYTGELVPDLDARLAHTIVPIVSWQMSTPPIPEDMRSAVIPGRQAVSDTRGDLRFFRYDAGNRLITGGAVIGTRDVIRRLTARVSENLAEAFPALGRQPMTHVWNGYVGMTPDYMPRIHRLGDGAWTWTGCNGRGVALSVALGRELARAASGARLDSLALPESKLRPLPLHGLVRRIAPSYLAWLRRKDLAEQKN
ncbi:FAD-binding oxidoreductase [Paracoccus suum]|uniref:FAD-binding oxidoreductase n=1 Tax=Paracoccus suum TaxID=2259340 RepID=A0A344PMZ2_9RHOB|nr:FAD-dependent oxidoreductase [Paracoccus suum]AXC50747.1 FAD-binding oxidoreductase [Paracoccus suum]